MKVTAFKEHIIKEKRKSSRKKCSARVGYAYLDSNHTAIIENISQEGAFINSKSLPDIGKKLLMTIKFSEDSEPISIIGEVVWLSPRGIGVKFNSGFDAGLIESYLNDTQQADVDNE